MTATTAPRAKEVIGAKILEVAERAQTRKRERLFTESQANALAEEFARIKDSLPGTWYLVSRAACPAKMASSYRNRWDATVVYISQDGSVSADRQQMLGTYNHYLLLRGGAEREETAEQQEAAKALGYTNKGGAWAKR